MKSGFHEQMVLNFGIKLYTLLLHYMLTHLTRQIERVRDPAPRSIDSIFRFLFTIGFSFLPYSLTDLLPHSHELAYMHHHRVVKLVMFHLSYLILMLFLPSYKTFSQRTDNIRSILGKSIYNIQVYFIIHYSNKFIVGYSLWWNYFVMKFRKSFLDMRVSGSVLSMSACPAKGQ